MFELLILDDEMSEALRKSDTTEFVRAAKSSPLYHPLVESALTYAAEGTTSLSEVFRVAEQIDESIDFQEIEKSNA